MNQKQFSGRSLFTASFWPPYSALFDHLNPSYSASAQVLAPEFGTILPSAGSWNLRANGLSVRTCYLPQVGTEWSAEEVLG
jgi:hypothetical protein